MSVTDKNSRVVLTRQHVCTLTLEISRMSYITKTLYKCNDVIFDAIAALTGLKI